MNDIISIEKILQHSQDEALKRLDVPELGGCLYYKSLRAKELEVAKKEIRDEDPMINFMAQLVCLKALDSNGSRIFKNDRVKDFLDAVHPSVIERIYEEMRRVPAVEDAEKN